MITSWERVKRVPPSFGLVKCPARNSTGPGGSLESVSGVLLGDVHFVREGWRIRCEIGGVEGEMMKSLDMANETSYWGRRAIGQTQRLPVSPQMNIERDIFILKEIHSINYYLLYGYLMNPKQRINPNETKKPISHIYVSNYSASLKIQKSPFEVQRWWINRELNWKFQEESTYLVHFTYNI